MDTKLLLLVAAVLVLQGCANQDRGAPPLVCAPAVDCPALECPAQLCPEPSVITREVEIPATRHTSGGKELIVVGAREFVTLVESGVILEARVDTGAETSSLHALEVTPFERDGKRWVRFSVPTNLEGEDPVEFTERVRRTVRIKQIDAPDQRRYVVDLWVQVGAVRERLSFTLANRSNLDYPVLLGRNFLTDTAIVDVSRKHTLQ